MTRPVARNLIAVDLLRFACALMVVAFHWAHGLAHSPPPGGGPLLAGMAVDGRLAPFANSGWIGVELFFVVSGFVIAWSAEGSGARAFAGRRFLRLVPGAWLCASITAAAMIASGAQPAGEVVPAWLGSMLFWPMFGIDPSYWTLAIEVNFYLLIAAALLGGASMALIERVGAALGFASFLHWAAWCVMEVPPATERMVQLTLLPHGGFFALGILLRSRRAMDRRLSWWAGVVPAGIAALIEIEAHRIVMNSGALAYLPPLLLFGLGLLPIIFAEDLQGWLGERVPAATAGTIGLMTYPLYLLHQELGAILIGGLLHAGVGFWPAVVVAFGIVAGQSWVIARVAEPWLRGVLRPFARSGDARPRSGPPAVMTPAETPL